jgi:hypothetical protein
LNQGYDLYFSDLWFSGYNNNFFARQDVQVEPAVVAARRSLWLCRCGASALL